MSDEKKKQTYDQFGHEAFEQQQASGGAGGAWGQGGYRVYTDGSGFGGFSDPFDIFEQFFGGNSPFGGAREGRAQAQSRRQGDDLRYALEITLEEAVLGGTQEIQYRWFEKCDECSGSGAKKGTKTVTCKTCQGQGQVQRVQQTIFGSFATAKICPDCDGTGEKHENPCANCRGEGRLRVVHKTVVRIPKGVDNGTEIRYAGDGDAGAPVYLHGT